MDIRRVTSNEWHLPELTPGRHRFRVNLAGAERGAPCWSAEVVRGAADGPVLLVTAGVHGDEYEGMAGIRAFLRDLDPAELVGTIVAIPVVNEPAYQAASRTTPDDGLNLARTFPGKSDGTTTERIAYALRHHVLPQCTFFCDLHAGGMHYDVVLLSGYQLGTPEFNQIQYGACVAFDLPVIWATSYLPGRSLSAAREAGVPAMYVEYGGGGDCPEDSVEHCRVALRRVAGFLEMLDQPYPKQFGGTFVEDDGDESGHLQIQGIARASGFFSSKVRVWERVQAGQLVAEILDPFGGVLDTLEAQVDGRIVFLRRTCYVAEEESCFAVMTGAP